MQEQELIKVPHLHPIQQEPFLNPSAPSPSTSPQLCPFASIGESSREQENHQASHDPYPRRHGGQETNSSHPSETDRSIRLRGSPTIHLPKTNLFTTPPLAAHLNQNPRVLTQEATTKSSSRFLGDFKHLPRRSDQAGIDEVCKKGEYLTSLIRAVHSSVKNRKSLVYPDEHFCSSD